MNNPFGKVKVWIGKNKKEEWFKPVLAIIILTVLAFGAVSWRRWQDEKENTPERSETEQAEESLIEEIWDDSKLHLAMFVSLSAALLAVEHSKNRLKQTGGRKEK